MQQKTIPSRGRSPQKMKGGNGATSGSGITQFAEGEPKRLNCANQNDVVENHTGSRTKSTKDLSRKERKERKEMEGGNGAKKQASHGWLTLMARLNYYFANFADFA